MPTLSDIKLMTRNEAETLINTKEQEAEYLFQGWGSKFKLQNFTQTPTMEAKTYYPDDGYLGFEKVTILQAGHTAELEDKTFTTNGVYTPAEGKDGYRNVTVNVPVLGDTYMPYFDQTVLLDGTETTTFKAHVNKTSLFGPNAWLPGTAYALRGVKCTHNSTDLDYVEVEIQPAWEETDFDADGNVLFRLTQNFKVYANSSYAEVVSTGSDFTIKDIYDRAKKEQSASEQPTSPYILGPIGWKCSCYTYHDGEVVPNQPVQEINEYRAFIYFKVN